MARFEGPTTEVGWTEDPHEIRRDLNAPTPTYRYAERMAARFHDSPTVYMAREQDRPRNRKRAARRK